MRHAPSKFDTFFFVNEQRPPSVVEGTNLIEGRFNLATLLDRLGKEIIPIQQIVAMDRNESIPDQFCGHVAFPPFLVILGPLVHILHGCTSRIHLAIIWTRLLKHRPGPKCTCYASRASTAPG